MIWEAATLQPGLDRSGFGRWRQRCHSSKKKTTKKTKKMQASFFFFCSGSVYAATTKSVSRFLFHVIICWDKSKSSHNDIIFYNKQLKREDIIFQGFHLLLLSPIPWQNLCHGKPTSFIMNLSRIWTSSYTFPPNWPWLIGLCDKQFCNALNPIRTTNSDYNNTLLKKNIAMTLWVVCFPHLCRWR